MPVIRSVPKKTNPNSEWLLQHKRTIVSQHGEEGVLEKIFEVIGTKNKWCVEFGAWDGVYLSNTYYFIKELGWSAVLIEADPERFEELTQNFAGNEGVFPIRTFIGYEPGKDTIDDALKTTDIPTDFDLISIDIDGNDYHIWESMAVYRPRVVIIEFNPSVPNNVVFIQDRDLNIAHGCSLAALVELGRKKGYELVSVIGGNGVFVVAEEFEKFGIEDNSIDAMYGSRLAHGTVFQGYDGTLLIGGMTDLNWQGKGYALKYDSLQVVPMRIRSARSAWAASYLNDARNAPDDEKKLEILTAGLAVIPDNFALRLQMAKTQADLKNDEECERICRELIDIDPLDDEAHLLLSRILARHKKRKEALTVAEAGFRNRTCHANLELLNIVPVARQYLTLLMRFARFDEARETLDNLLDGLSEDSPNFYMLLATKAELLDKTDQHEEAFAAAEHAAKVPGPHDRPNEPAYRTACLSLLSLSKAEAAGEWIERYIELENATPRAMLDIAKRAKDKGFDQVSARLCDVVAERLPEGSPLHKELARLRGQDT